MTSFFCSSSLGACKSSLQRNLLPLLIAPLLAAPASAQVIADYAADADPTTEGFGIWPTNGGISTNGLADDQGMVAFQIQNTGASDEQAYYTMLGGTGPFGSMGEGSGLTSEQASEISTQGFTLSLEARVVQGPVLDTNGLFSANATVAGFDGYRYDIDLGTNANGDTTVVLPEETSFNNNQFTITTTNAPVVVAGSGYHLYQLSYNPASGVATLFIDGIAREFGYPGSAVAGGATAENYGLAFGVVNNAIGNFANVQLAVGQITVTPEPAVLLNPTLTNSQFGATVSGTIGWNYVVQTSTNLASTNWLPIFTNNAPFAFSDTNTSAPQQFYRAVSQ